MSSLDPLPPPCFYFAVCLGRAALEKNGKSLCPRCAGRVVGREYPLRTPTRAPLYRTGREAAEATGMVEPRRPGPDSGRRRARNV